MNRTQLEHVLRAAGAISGEREIIVIGSQALLASVAEPPEALCASMEVDLYPATAPEKADLIDGSIGEGSPFHETFGYYAHGVGPETALLPAGWRSRLVDWANANTQGVTARCLHPLDLAVSKLLAGRRKDIAFVKVMLSCGLIAADGIAQGIAELPEPEAAAARSRFDRLAREGGAG